MILNEGQLHGAIKKRDQLIETLSEYDRLSAIPKDIDPVIWESGKLYVKAEIDQLNHDIDFYSSLSGSKESFSLVSSEEELNRHLVYARISWNIEQSKIADLLGLSLIEFQRIETSGYADLDLKSKLIVAKYLKLSVSYEIASRVNAESKKFDYRQYPFQEMYSRKWFNTFIGDIAQATRESDRLLDNFFQLSEFNKLEEAYNRRTFRSNSTLDDNALNAWYARVMFLAKKQAIYTGFHADTINDAFIIELRKISQSSTGPIEALDFLRNNGIRVVIEPQLRGTHIDGAAFNIDTNSPAIALTLRHDRLDNFWFVLFHELAHIKLHIKKSDDVIFDDLDDVKDLHSIENEADEFAANALIPNKAWTSSFLRFKPTKEAITLFAHNNNVSVSVVAGRLRKEGNKYNQFSDLIGQGLVRKMFNIQ